MRIRCREYVSLAVIGIYRYRCGEGLRHAEAVLTIRPATVEDAEEIAGVHVRAWQVGYRGLLADDYLDGLQAKDRMRRYTFGLTGPDHPATSVAIAEGALCGMVTTGLCRDEDAPESGEVYALYVDPARWGSGVGRLLIAEARASLRSQGLLDARLWMLAGNERGHRFYSADGWHMDGQRRQAEVWGVWVDEVLFHRRLT